MRVFSLVRSGGLAAILLLLGGAVAGASTPGGATTSAAATQVIAASGTPGRGDNSSIGVSCSASGYCSGYVSGQILGSHFSGTGIVQANFTAGPDGTSPCTATPCPDGGYGMVDGTGTYRGQAVSFHFLGHDDEAASTNNDTLEVEICTSSGAGSCGSAVPAAASETFACSNCLEVSQRPVNTGTARSGALPR